MYYFDKGETRNYLLMTLCVYTALRISDILLLYCEDVYDFEKRKVKKSMTIVEKKTKKSKTIALNKSIVAALAVFLPNLKPGMPLIRNNRTNKAISRTQAYRITRTAGEDLNLPQRISCHSLRKTFGYHTWNDGVSPVVIMDIYNHSSLAVTKRYLGITQDDRNAVYMSLDFL